MKACSSSLLRSLMSMAGPFVPTVLSYVCSQGQGMGFIRGLAASSGLALAEGILLL